MQLPPKAILYVTLCILLWGSTAAAAKLFLGNLESHQSLFYIATIAFVTLTSIAAISGKLSAIARYRPKDILRMMNLGGIGILLYNLLFYAALKYSSAQEAFICNYTWPIWVVVFASIAGKERFTLKKTLALLAGFLGVVVIATKGSLFAPNNQYFFGDALALLGAVCYGLYSALGKKYTYEPIHVMIIGFLTTAVVTASMNIGFGTLVLPTATQWIGIAWLGIATAGLAFLFWLKALRLADTAIISNLIFLTPVASIIYIAIVLGEPILLSSVIGLLIIIAGALIQRLPTKA